MAAARRAPSASTSRYRAGRPIVDDDRLGEGIRVGRGEVHAPARAVLVEPVTDVEVLLEVMGEREVDERPLGGGELHRRREPALHDGEVADGEVAIQPIDVAVHLETGRVVGGSRGRSAGRRRRSCAGPGTVRRAIGVRGDRHLEQVAADARTADGDHADLFVVAIAELGAPLCDLIRSRRHESGDVAGEVEVRFGPLADARAGRGRSSRARRRRRCRRRSIDHGSVGSCRCVRSSRRCSRP